MQFISYQRVARSMERAEYAKQGLSAASRYYDDFSESKTFPYSLGAKTFCAQREGLSFQFQFEKGKLKTWVWKVNDKELYIKDPSTEAPTVITNYQKKENILYWNIQLMGKIYSFSALPYVFEEGASFLRGHSEVMPEGPC